MSKMGDSGNTGCKTGWIQERIDIGYETGRKQNRFAVGQDEKAGAVECGSAFIFHPRSGSAFNMQIRVRSRREKFTGKN